MKKPILFLSLFLILLVPFTFSQVNLDFTMNLEEKIYYPSEEIEVEINVINRDFQFRAKDAVLSMQIGDRFYDFELGDLKPDATFTEVIKLPEFTPGSKTIRGTLNYTFFGERWSEETYNGFEVAFPPIERYPRNVNVIGFDLPDKLIAGKEYEVTVTVKNEGSVGGGMIVEVASLEEFADEEIGLEPGETETVSLKVKFINPEVSLIEARIYALINGEKYLLHYSGRKAYLEEEKVAKLSVDKIAYIGESDKEINQKDTVTLKIYLKNDGNYAAAEVKGILSSSNEKIEIIDSTVDYVLVVAGDISAPEKEHFKIKTNDVETGKHTVKLEVSYLDTEQRKKGFIIPIQIASGKDVCTEDNDCEGDEYCDSGTCKEVTCECGYIVDKKCIEYDCCADRDCDELSTCNSEIHKCIEKSGCISILHSGDSNDKADFLVIGAQFDNSQELKQTITELFDLEGNSKNLGFFSVEPFKSNKNKFNIWMIKAPDYRVYGGSSCSTMCNNAVDFSSDSEYISKCPNADYTVTIFKDAKFRSCAGGGQWSSIKCQSASDKGKLILHESGHSFGRLADEYVEPSLGDRAWGPNCVDTMEDANNKWGDLIGVKGVDYFYGCSYTQENIRPTKNSLMRSHYSASSYGPVNERAIEKILRGYK